MRLPSTPRVYTWRLDSVTQSVWWTYSTENSSHTSNWILERAVRSSSHTAATSSLAKMTKKSGCTNSTRHRSRSTLSSLDTRSLSRGLTGLMMIQVLSHVAKMQPSTCGNYTLRMAKLVRYGASSWPPRFNLALLPASSQIENQVTPRVESTPTSTPLEQIVAFVRSPRTRRERMSCHYATRRTWPTLKSWSAINEVSYTLVSPNRTVLAQFKFSVTRTTQ